VEKQTASVTEFTISLVYEKKDHFSTLEKIESWMNINYVAALIQYYTSLLPGSFDSVLYLLVAPHAKHALNLRHWWLSVLFQHISNTTRSSMITSPFPFASAFETIISPLTLCLPRLITSFFNYVCLMITSSFDWVICMITSLFQVSAFDNYIITFHLSLFYMLTSRSISWYNVI